MYTKSQSTRGVRLKGHEDVPDVGVGGWTKEVAGGSDHLALVASDKGGASAGMGVEGPSTRSQPGVRRAPDWALVVGEGENARIEFPQSSAAAAMRPLETETETETESGGLQSWPSGEGGREGGGGREGEGGGVAEGDEEGGVNDGVGRRSNASNGWKTLKVIKGKKPLRTWKSALRTRFVDDSPAAAEDGKAEELHHPKLASTVSMMMVTAGRSPSMAAKAVKFESAEERHERVCERWSSAIGRVTTMSATAHALRGFRLRSERWQLREVDPLFLINRVKFLCSRKGARTSAAVHELVVIAGFFSPFVRDQPVEAQYNLAAVVGYEEYTRGRMVCRQGELGDKFFILLEGCVSVQGLADRTVHMLGLLGRGDYFGDISLFHDAPRMASCVARTTSHCLVVDKPDFMALYRDKYSFRCAHSLKFLRSKVGAFKGASEPKLRTFAHFLSLMCFQSDRVFRVDCEEKIFFIASGTCQLLIPIPKTDPRFRLERFRSVTVLHEGAFFGESSAFENLRYGWMVRSIGRVELYVIRAQDFTTRADKELVRRLYDEAEFRTCYYLGRFGGTRKQPHHHHHHHHQHQVDNSHGSCSWPLLPHAGSLPTCLLENGVPALSSRAVPSTNQTAVPNSSAAATTSTSRQGSPRRPETAPADQESCFPVGPAEDRGGPGTAGRASFCLSSVRAISATGGGVPGVSDGAFRSPSLHALRGTLPPLDPNRPPELFTISPLPDAPAAIMMTMRRMLPEDFESMGGQRFPSHPSFLTRPAPGSFSRSNSPFHPRSSSAPPTSSHLPGASSPHCIERRSLLDEMELERRRRISVVPLVLECLDAVQGPPRLSGPTRGRKALLFEKVGLPPPTDHKTAAHHHSSSAWMRGMIRMPAIGRMWTMPANAGCVVDHASIMGSAGYEHGMPVRENALPPRPHSVAAIMMAGSSSSRGLALGEKDGEKVVRFQ